MEHRGARIALPRKGAAELEQFPVQLLKSTCFRQRPTADTRRVEEREFGVLSGRSAPCVKGHEGARFVIHQHREPEIDVQKANQSVQGEMVLGCDNHASLVQTLQGALTVKFSGMEKHERSVFSGMAERLEQPRWKPLACRDVFRCDVRCSLHENRLFWRTVPRLFQHARRWGWIRKDCTVNEVRILFEVRFIAPFK